MWICDAGQLYDSISDNWCGIGIANVSEILEFVKYAPTIDPETIPIVRQLREELARVMEERDNLKELLYDVKPCSLCEKYTKTWNPVCIKCDSSTKAYRPDFVLNERGQQKEE